MNNKGNEEQEDNDLIHFDLMTNSMSISKNKSNFGIDLNDSNIQKKKYIKTDKDLANIQNSYLLSSSIPSNKNYKEDCINNNIDTLQNENNDSENINKINDENVNIKEIKNSSNNNNLSINSKAYNKQNSKNIFDAKIFSDDDMSLNKSNKLINQNNSNHNINNIDNNSSTNSLMFSLNIKDLAPEANNNDDDINYNLKNDIKKILPNDIYNSLNPSENSLILNIKEGLKKLFIYLSDSLNNQKKISGSNDYYYNNDLNSENLLKIYIFIKSILNNFQNIDNDIINESLFIINLILPLLPTNYINNICDQLIDIFYYKTSFEELSKNNYLLFKQILRLNQINFFDKIFLFLKNEKNFEIKHFWKEFISDLIKKNNENYGIGFDINNNESIINLLNEYHKDDLVNFCLNLFNYNDLKDITTNKDAYELIKCIYYNKILFNENENNDDISFKEKILDKVKDNETLYLNIKNIFDEKKINSNYNDNNNEENNIQDKKIHRSKIKRMNIDKNDENKNTIGNSESVEHFLKVLLGILMSIKIILTKKKNMKKLVIIMTI